MGRNVAYPTVVTPEIITKIETLSECGSSLKMIAAYFGISVDSLANWRRNEPAIEQAYKNGKDKGSIKLLDTAFQQAVNGNTAVLIFLLKTRLGMSERPVLDLSSAKLNKIIDIIINTVKDPEELKAIEAKMRQEIDVDDDNT